MFSGVKLQILGHNWNLSRIRYNKQLTGYILKGENALSSLMLMYLHRWRHQETYGWCCQTLHVGNNETNCLSWGYKALSNIWLMSFKDKNHQG